MEVDFAGKTFELIDKLTGESTKIVVFVAVLPYSQYIYAEGITSLAEAQWIKVNNHALNYFGGVPSIVVCDNCKQAVIAKALGIQACLKYRTSYHHCEEFLETMVALKQTNYAKYQKKVRFFMKLDLLILDDFLLHTITDEREIKVLFEILEKRSELSRSTIVCSQ